jgi:hypothetical protein
MIQKVVQENELLGLTFRALGTEGAALLQELSKNDKEELRETLAHVLVDAAKDSVGVTVGTAELPSGHSFKSIILRTPGAKTNRIYTFTFKDAAVETMLPIMGIALTIYTGKWGIATIPQVGGVLKTLWSKLVVLKRSEDADAIDVVKAIVRLRAKHQLGRANR